MSITIGSSVDSALIKTSSPQALKTANVAQSQQETEAQMALQLIQSATIQVPSLPSGNSGHNINIRA